MLQVQSLSSQNERVERRQDQGLNVPSEDVTMVISLPSTRTHLLRLLPPLNGTITGYQTSNPGSGEAP